MTPAAHHTVPSIASTATAATPVQTQFVSCLLASPDALTEFNGFTSGLAQFGVPIGLNEPKPGGSSSQPNVEASSIVAKKELIEQNPSKMVNGQANEKTIYQTIPSS